MTAAVDRVHGHGSNPASLYGGWGWDQPRHGEHFRRCSFCGSIHPDDLVAEAPGTGCGFPNCPEPNNPIADLHYPPIGIMPTPDWHTFVETGWRAQWSDGRKYGWPHKFYVNIVNRTPDRLYVVGSSNRRPDPTPVYGPYLGVDELDDEQRQALERDGYNTADWPADQNRFYQFGTHPNHHAKFYAMHLADPAIADETRELIAATSGLRFTFTDDGHVGWEPTTTADPASGGTP